MNKFAFALVLSLLPVAALAQAPQLPQSPDPAFMQRAITALQTQRNQALDNAAVAEAKATGAEAELTKERAHSKELEDKLNPPKKDEPKK